MYTYCISYYYMFMRSFFNLCKGLNYSRPLMIVPWLDIEPPHSDKALTSTYNLAK